MSLERRCKDCCCGSDNEENVSRGTKKVTFVVRFEKGERQSELVADDIDHGLTLQKQWIDAGASYVEIFRVFEYDGKLNPTIGPYYKD